MLNEKVCLTPLGYPSSLCGNLCFGMGAKSTSSTFEVTCGHCLDTLYYFEQTKQICRKHPFVIGIFNSLTEECCACSFLKDCDPAWDPNV